MPGLCLFAVFSADMTTRKPKMMTRSALTRELRAITNCNQALLRAENEQGLIEEICRIICEEAGYRMAWVGYVNHDEARSVTPRAWSGAEEDYLSQEGLTWADNPAGHRPLGIAIRSGETAYAQDLTREYESIPWAEHAKARGFRSAIALPLKDEQGNTFGVLCIYSAKIQAFTPDEIKLLEELAADLAFGIMTLRARIERERAKEILEAQEFKFRTVVDYTYDWEYWVGPNQELLYISPSCERITGYSSAEFEADPDLLDRIVYPADRDIVDAHLSDHINRGKSLLEFRIVHRDGGIRWITHGCQPVYGPNREFMGHRVSNRDDTERKEAEEKLVVSEQLFRTMVENSPDYIARYDRDLRRIYINPALRELFKAPVGQLLGKRSNISSPLSDPERYMACIRRVVETASEFTDEFSYRRLDGEIRWASIRFAPEFGPDGKVASVLAISHDITKRKRAEEERKAYLHFLQSMDRINRVLQEEGDIEQVMKKVLDEVLAIFDCDRAYLVYPCDPDASTWSVPIESTKPEYPGAGQQGPQSMNDHVAWVMKTLLESGRSIQLGPGAEFPLPEMLLKQFGIHSNMVMALYPRVDKPWQFGIHQCSRDRIWTEEEIRLFEEIGRRLSDGLNSLLIARNLRESEERFRLVFENSPLPIWEEDFSAVKARLDELKDVYGDDVETYLAEHPEVVRECGALVRVVSVNKAVLELHEADSKGELLTGLSRVFLPESYDAFQRELVALVRGQTELIFDAAVQTLNGKRREVTVYFSVCPGYERSLRKVFISLVDITERKQVEGQLRLAASVFKSSQEGILISDAENRIIDINPAFTRLTGYTRDEVLGQNPRILSSGRQSQEFYAGMWRSLNARGEWQGEIWNKHKSGEVYAELLSIVAVKDSKGRLQHYVGAFTDISALKQHEADLDRIAHYDVLTSVPNRRLLSDRLEQAIARTRRHGKSLAVCYLDLDGFKPINDQYGHEGGDRMLVEIARRLQSMLRAEDTVARLGGDEFVLLWNDIEKETDCVQALERVLSKVSEPMLLEGEPVAVSASIGVTLYPDDNVDADNLLRHADHAMYSAKQLGKNRYQIFDARLERQLALRGEFLAKVERGLEQGQFELYYQPKVDCIAGKLHGVEALLRWNDPVLGLVGPKEFLPLIENDSLAFRMGRWVMEEAVRQGKAWNDMGISVPISVNVFPRHLKYRTFVDDLRNAIQTFWPEMPKNHLQMEIVESSDLEQLEPIEQVIRECVEMGVGFSLDDFGTGYSSLVYLRRLSIQEIKIDQSFVRDMLENQADHAIVAGVIGMGRAFKLRVVAEGVETPKQVRYLMNLGCSVVQGYGLAQPMRAESFQEWYADFLINGVQICR